MTDITITNDVIKCEGHASNDVACAMLTALTVSLADSLINLYAADVDCVLDIGFFELTIREPLHDDPDAMLMNSRLDMIFALISSYVYSVKKLALSRPEDFTVTDVSDFLKS